MLLKLDSQGDDVKKVQVMLGLKADGEFGSATEEAVKAWQTANSLTADGIVDEVTFNKMFLNAAADAPTSAEITVATNVAEELSSSAAVEQPSAAASPATTSVAVEQPSVAEAANMSERAFVAQHSVHFNGNQDKARAHHQNVLRQNNRSMHLAAALHGALASPHFRNSRLHHVQQGENLPDYKELFGGLDYCECEECKSIFGPAAYFVDLMNIADGYIITQPNANNFKLKARRPDLWNIPLTCAKTNDLVPYLQIVNERLQDKAANTMKLQTPTLYQVMASTENYPLLLPFHYPLDQIRLLTQQVGVSLADVYAAWRVKPADVWLVWERLGLSSEQALLITTPNETKPKSYYGNPESLQELKPIAQFLEKTGLTRLELNELLTQNLSAEQIRNKVSQHLYINQNLGDNFLKLENDSSLSNLDNAALDRIHRLRRLAKTLKWSFETTDWCLRTVKNPGPDGKLPDASITDGHLADLDRIARFAAAFKLTPIEASVLFGPLKTYGGDGTTPPGGEPVSLFDRLFNDPSNVAKLGAYRPKGHPLSDNTIFKDEPLKWEPGSTNAVHIAAINRVAHGLGLPLEAATALGQYLFAKPNTNPQEYDEVPLTVEKLSTLYRHTLLARCFGLPMERYLLLLDLRLSPIRADKKIITGQELDNLVAGWRWLNASKLELPLLNYVLRGTPSAYVDPLFVDTDATDATITNWLKSLINTPNLSKLKKTLKALQTAVTAANTAAADSVTKVTLLKDKLIGNATGEQKSSAQAAQTKAVEELSAAVSSIKLSIEPPIKASALAKAKSATSLANDLAAKAQEVQKAISSINPDEWKNAAKDSVAATTKTAAAVAAVAKALEALVSIEQAATTEIEQAIIDQTAHFFNVEPKLAGPCLKLAIKAELTPATAKAKATPTLIDVIKVLVQCDDKGAPSNAAYAKDLLSWTSRWLVLSKAASLTPELLENLVKHPTAYGLTTDKKTITWGWDVIRNVERMASLIRQFGDVRGDLLGYISGGTAEALTAATGWPKDQVDLLLLKKDFITQPGNKVESLLRMQTCFRQIAALGANVPFMIQLAALAEAKADTPADWDAFTTMAQQCLALVKGRYGVKGWRQAGAQIEGKLEVRKRDALVSLLLAKLELPNLKLQTPNQLYEYLLLDVEAGPELQVSYIKDALNTLQLYLQRCRLGLEAGADTDDIPPVWWEWLMDYRKWEANRRIFLYPENYLLPSLRRDSDKTGLFRQLENDLHQSEPTKEYVEDAYAAYLDGFSQVAQLRPVEAYRCRLTDPKLGPVKALYLFARTHTAPFCYYLCRQLEREPGEEGPWSEWEKIDLSINAEYITPVYAFHRLFLFWIDIQETRSAKVKFDKDGGQTDSNRVFKATVQYSFQNHQGKWVTPQTLVKDKVVYYEGSGDDALPPFNKDSFISIDAKNSENIFSVLCKARILDQNGVLLVDTIIEKTVLGVVDLKDNQKDHAVVNALRYHTYHTALKKNFNMNSRFWKQVTVLRITADNWPNQKAPYADAERIVVTFGPSLYSDSFTPPDPKTTNPDADAAAFLALLEAWKGETAQIPNDKKDQSAVPCVGFWLLDSGLRQSKSPFDIAFASKPLFKDEHSDAGKIPVENQPGWFLLDVGNEAFLLQPQPDAADADMAEKKLKVAVINGNSGPQTITITPEKIAVTSATTRYCLECTNTVAMADKYKVTRITTAAPQPLSQALFAGGIDRLLSLDTQNIPPVPILPFSRFGNVNNPEPPKAADGAQIDFDGVYGQYFWELFFHGPLMVANTLAGQQQFREAFAWFHYIFNPTAKKKLVTENTFTEISPTSFNLQKSKEIFDVLKNTNQRKIKVETFKKETSPNGEAIFNILKNGEILSDGFLIKHGFSPEQSKALFDILRKDIFRLTQGALKIGFQRYAEANKIPIINISEILKDDHLKRLMVLLKSNNLINNNFQVNKKYFKPTDYEKVSCDNSISRITINNKSFCRVGAGWLSNIIPSFYAPLLNDSGVLHYYCDIEDIDLSCLYVEYLSHEEINKVKSILSLNSYLLKNDANDSVTFNPKFTATSNLDFLKNKGFGLGVNDIAKIREVVLKYLTPVFENDGNVHPNFTAVTNFDFLKDSVSITDDQITMVRNILLNHQLATPAARCWQFRPFRNQRIETLMETLANNSPAWQAYENDPFNPFAIARLRIGAFEKATLMQYIDTLIQWGDYYFAQDSWESIVAATMVYVYASDLLGPRPQPVARYAPKADMTYGTLVMSALLSKLEAKPVAKAPQAEPAGQQAALPSKGKPVTAQAHAYTGFYPYFCVPENKQFVGYWDKVEDRLHKIRHSLDLKGRSRQMALFEPPLDPLALVKAAASSNPMPSESSQAAKQAPRYRFRIALERARRLASTSSQLGAALLAALEKKDGEALALLRNRQEQLILSLTRQIKQSQVERAKASLAALQAHQSGVKVQLEHYTKLLDEGLSAGETAQLVLMDVAEGFNVVSTIAETVAAVALAVPNVGSPFAMTYGGREIGGAWRSIATVSRIGAESCNYVGQRVLTVAGYHRREQEWTLTKNMTQSELDSVTQQLSAAQTELDAARQDLLIHDKTVIQNQEMEAYLKDKFTTQDLYQWMAGRLSALHFQTYCLAMQAAAAAQQAFQYETDRTDTFLSFDYWDGGRKGLLAGEGLSTALDFMEASYIEGNQRRLEIERVISLAQIAPSALAKLKTEGVCEFAFSELLFDYDYPGHYARKIKSVSLSIPAVLGPYQNIKAMLTQTKSQVAVSGDLTNVEYLVGGQQKKPATVWEGPFPDNGQKIAVSSGVNDSGLFVLDFQDERYLPFEGTGAVSSWKLEMPRETNHFDFDRLTDVLITLRYSALHDDGLKKDVEKFLATKPLSAWYYVPIKQFFPREWDAFLPKQKTESALTTRTLSFSYLPAWQGMSKERKIRQISLQITLSPDIKWPKTYGDMEVTLKINNQPQKATVKEGLVIFDAINFQKMSSIIKWEIVFDLGLISDDALKKGLTDPTKLLDIGMMVCCDVTIF